MSGPRGWGAVWCNTYGVLIGGAAIGRAIAVGADDADQAVQKAVAADVLLAAGGTCRLCAATGANVQDRAGSSGRGHGEGEDGDGVGEVHFGSGVSEFGEGLI